MKGLSHSVRVVIALGAQEMDSSIGVWVRTQVSASSGIHGITTSALHPHAFSAFSIISLDANNARITLLDVWFFKVNGEHIATL